MTEVVAYEARGAAAHITIDRAERRNAVNPEVVRGLRSALQRAEADDAVKAVVITGAGDKAFCAGGDLGGMSDSGAVAQHLERAEIGELFEKMTSSRLPIVARVNGHALGGGFGLMLACDLVVAVEDAKLGTPEVNIGLWPFIITTLIQRDVPRKIALEMMMTGKRVDAHEGERWGFVNRVVSRAELDAAVEGLVDDLGAKSPLILALGKRSFYAAQDLAFREGIEYLGGMLTLCLQSEDTVEGVTAFLQKRPPQWKGR